MLSWDPTTKKKNITIFGLSSFGWMKGMEIKMKAKDNIPTPQPQTINFVVFSPCYINPTKRSNIV